MTPINSKIYKLKKRVSEYPKAAPIERKFNWQNRRASSNKSVTTLQAPKTSTPSLFRESESSMTTWPQTTSTNAQTCFYRKGPRQRFNSMRLLWKTPRKPKTAVQSNPSAEASKIYLFQYWSKMSFNMTIRRLKNVLIRLSRLVELFSKIMTVWQCLCKARATIHPKEVSEKPPAEIYTRRASCHALSFATEAKA